MQLIQKDRVTRRRERTLDNTYLKLILQEIEMSIYKINAHVCALVRLYDYTYAQM